MIDLQNVSFGYGRKGRLFTDFTLHLDAGHVYGLLGSNGVGKTTLLKMLCGLLSPSKGRIEVLGENPARRRASLYGRIFVVPEEFDLPAVKFRTFVRTTAPLYPDFSHEMLAHAVEVMEVDMDSRLTALSMGQRKRALLAFALACNVRLLIMDEPTNGLDIPAKAAFRRLVSEYAAGGRTVIVSTHQVRDVEMLIDEVVILDRRGVLLHESLSRVAQRLTFGSVEKAEAVYAEESLQGTVGVAQNLSDTESRIDLELLFEAAVHDPERLQRIFNQPSQIEA